jgi:hypothetical protein
MNCGNRRRLARVIKRYGSEEAALAPCEREQLLRAAVKKWSKFCAKPYQRWTQSIDGYSDAYELTRRQGLRSPRMTHDTTRPLTGRILTPVEP